ncbi:MAG: hypothetical protein IT497_03800 [Ottowia sp.]|nr:hypothetical protein [Ottowia sp.]
MESRLLAIADYGLTISQFESAFNDVVDDDVFSALAKAAADGNAHSIDALHNLALRDDAAGNKAEKILFDLFSKKTPGGKVGLEKDIQLTSLKLYQTKESARAAGKDLQSHAKLSTPSALLYMAGGVADRDSLARENINKIFNQAAGQAYSVYEQVGRAEDIWATNRDVSHDELNDAVGALDSDTVSFCSPVGLIHPESHDNILAQIVSEKIRGFDQFAFGQPCGGGRPTYFPVNVSLKTGDGHWVLFGLYADPVSGNNKCVVFDSNHCLSDRVKDDLYEAALCAGVTRDDFVYIGKNLQAYAPNGCGLFVYAAAQHLAAHPELDPVDVINTFSAEFALKDAELQAQFNIDYRRQIYGDFLGL